MGFAEVAVNTTEPYQDDAERARRFGCTNSSSGRNCGFQNGVGSVGPRSGSGSQVAQSRLRASALAAAHVTCGRRTKLDELVVAFDFRHAAGT